ncbi:MAG TPA: hypothetical protein P5105_03375, partial [Victivallales bacterium]|nr:hypothetical protein [Victivallales bacterium]
QSEIRFPGISLTFTNNFFETEKKFKLLFSDYSEQFDKLVDFISEFNAFSIEEKEKRWTRQVLRSFINNRTFEDIILLPLMYYGNACEEDMDLSQFVIMFRSIFMEGLCRPEGGIKTIIRILEKKLKENNCSIINRNPVEKISPLSSGIFEILLSDGSILTAEKIISCIGYNETLDLVDKISQTRRKSYGQIAFCEAIFCLKESIVKEFADFRNACTFFCETDKFDFKKPSKAYSTESGVFCVPTNFKYLSSRPEVFFLRLTTLANFEYWIDESPERYKKLKLEFEEEALAKIAKLLNTKISREDISFSDTFTPRTILRWTGHKNGAIYGSPVKAKDGKTEVPNLYVCGTDQGFLGITGSILSGISIANKYALQ